MIRSEGRWRQMLEPTITKSLLIKAEQTIMLYDGVAYLGLGTAVFATGLLWLNGGLLEQANLPWGGALLLAALLYLLPWAFWKYSTPDPLSSGKWLNFPLPAVLLSGYGWGSLAGIHSPYYAGDAPLLTTLIVSISVLLTVMMLAAYGRIAAVFLLTCISSLLLSMVNQEAVPAGDVQILMLTAIIGITVTLMSLSLALGTIAHLRAGKRNVHGKLFQAREKMSGLHSQLSVDNERRRDVEQELVLAKEAAESANMVKTEFLATMSHEIRTPLNSIIPLLEVLGGTELTREQNQLVSTALNSSLHLITIIDDILDFTKIEAGKLELESIEIRLKELVESVTAMMAKSAERRKLELSYRIAANVPDFVRGDPIRLRQVLTNLVSNAIKFTKQGAILVEVTCEGMRRKEVKLLFSVKDSGVGLTQEAQDRLFHSFTQADASTTRTHGGTGLGLAISKKLVQLMGGRMGVESEEGRGSTFYFAISMRKSLRDVPPDRYSLKGIRVLLVGNDKEEVVRCTRYLDQWSMMVQSTGGVMDALSKLTTTATLGESWAYELAIVDAASMGSGLKSLIRDISRVPALAELKLVIIGEPHRSISRERIHGVLSKPVQKNDLYRILCRVLDVERQEGEVLLNPVGLGESNRHLLADVEHGQWEDEDQFAVSTSTLHQLTGRVLVVEDNPVNLRVARKLLQRLGLESEAATDGQEALKALDGGGYDLVLMDCQMPVMDGYQATRSVRQSEAQRGLARLPIIAMTANAMAGDRQKCLDAGMDDYLSKPILTDILKKTLKKWLPEGERAGSVQAVEADDSLQGRNWHATAEDNAVYRVPSVGPSVSIDAEIIAELYDVMGSDFIELLETFLATSPALMEELGTGQRNGNLQMVLAAAHSLKSSSANLGAMHFSNLAKTLEFAAREGDLQLISDNYPATLAAYQAASRELRAICDRGVP